MNYSCFKTTYSGQIKNRLDFLQTNKKYQNEVSFLLYPRDSCRELGEKDDTERYC